MGSAKAAVLPEPVCAQPMTSRPAMTSGMHAACVAGHDETMRRGTGAPASTPGTLGCVGKRRGRCGGDQPARPSGRRCRGSGTAGPAGGTG
jgi:hypothetical protein